MPTFPTEEWFQAYIEATNADPKPFVGTADPDHILKKVRRGYQALDQIH